VLEQFKSKVDARTAKVGGVGLWYVGLLWKPANPEKLSDLPIRELFPTRARTFAAPGTNFQGFSESSPKVT
jgi:hypothetical protein